MIHQSLPYKIVLGSTSPRRQQLLKSLHLPYELRTQASDETYPSSLPLDEVPIFLAQDKAKNIPIHAQELLITADTIVLLENEILGKAADAQEAFDILKKISGKKHTVITGICFSTLEKQVCFSDKTDVFFRELHDEEIQFYIDTCQPFDKAGAYGIQEWIGMVGIQKIEGCYFNVMGFPLQRIYTELQCFI